MSGETIEINDDRNKREKRLRLKIDYNKVQKSPKNYLENDYMSAQFS